MSGRRQGPRNTAGSRLAEVALRLAAIVAASAILLLVAYLVVEAAPLLWDPHVRLAELWQPRSSPGHAAASALWQPDATPPKLSLLPLFLGTLRVTAVALVVATPVAVLAALYVAREARKAVREVLKPTIEMLAAVPSVLLGFLALTVLSTFLQDAFGLSFRLNALVAGVALSAAVLPVVFTVSEDALRAVPHELTDAALALGARRWQVYWRVVLPSAAPGIAAAIVLGGARAVSETMIVLMASGNAPVLDLFDPTTGAATVTATLAAELGEASRGGTHWRVLFLLGLLLFTSSWALHVIGHRAAARLRARLHGEGGDA